MNKKMLLQSYPIRHAISVGVAVFLAAWVSFYFAYADAVWLVLSAYLVSQTTRGTPLRQGMVLFLLMIIALVMTYFLSSYIPQQLMNVIAILTFIVFAYLIFLQPPQQNKGLLFAIFFPLIFLIAIYLAPFPPFVLREKLIAVIVGALIGIVCGQLIFPVHFANEFRSSIIPILDILIEYSKVLTEGFLRHARDNKKLSAEEEQAILKQENALEVALQVGRGNYPEWVYEVGFNPGLRSGFRFFLINLERATELFFSMSYLVTRDADVTLIQNLAAPITITMQKNQELLNILIEYFKHGKLIDTQSDFTSDIAELEKVTRTVVPGTLELLDISPYYLILIAFTRDIRDLRNILLQLVIALPGK